jgi:hypothetical protein
MGCKEGWVQRGGGGTKETIEKRGVRKREENKFGDNISHCFHQEVGDV